MAVKEIESALGNKTMNDASKKGLFELLELGLGVGWRGSLEKRIFIKRENKGDWQQKRNGGLLCMAVRRRKDGMEGEICEIRGTTEELLPVQCDRERKKGNKGAMNEADVYMSRAGGGMQESRESGYRERERGRSLMITEDRSLFVQPLFPVD